MGLNEDEKHAVAVVASEILKFIVQGTVAYMKTQGLSDAQVDEALTQVRAEFESRDPADLPDV